MNRLVIAAAGAVLIATGAFVTGWRVNNWRHDSQALAMKQAAEAAATAATDAAVKAISKIRVQNTTIRQELEREIRFAPATAECDISRGVFDAINKALTEPARRGAGLPATDPAG